LCHTFLKQGEPNADEAEESAAQYCDQRFDQTHSRPFVPEEEPSIQVQVQQPPYGRDRDSHTGSRMEIEVTVVKPKPDHPWHERIQNDVDRAKLRARIAGLKERIAELKKELKTLEGRIRHVARDKREA
jgi:hypothetical protein